MCHTTDKCVTQLTSVLHSNCHCRQVGGGGIQSSGDEGVRSVEDHREQRGVQVGPDTRCMCLTVAINTETILSFDVTRVL